MIALFNEEPAFHRRRFFHGQAIHGTEAKEIVWLDPTGKEMPDDAWNAAYVRCLGVQLFCDKLDVDEQGEDVSGSNLLVLFNGDHANAIDFVLPPPGGEMPWELSFDTARLDANETSKFRNEIRLEPCSMVVLRSRRPKVEEEL